MLSFQPKLLGKESSARIEEWKSGSAIGMSNLPD
jgi:hypothetical protein